jgi:glycerol-3-phosphate acyltransferase PlsX
MLAAGEGDAFVSTGNTGALFAGATLLVKRIRGIQRAALATVLPGQNPVMLLDCGANVVVEPEYLEQFALMGSIYMKKMFSLDAPRVALLNNGSESCKGTPMHVEAYQRLSQMDGINFIGNMEANRFAFDTCDVLVTDGFTGNILLKGVEGIGKLMFGSIKSALKSSPMATLGALLVKKPLRGMKKQLDPNEYGGAPLLGIAHPVIKAHGSSNAKAFKNAIRQAIRYAESGMIEEISKEAAVFDEKRKQEREAARAEKAKSTATDSE